MTTFTQVKLVQLVKWHAEKQNRATVKPQSEGEVMYVKLTASFFTPTHIAQISLPSLNNTIC